MLRVTTGVPQGSTLGPLLFLIYVNDMHACLSNLTCIHFADDTTVSLFGDNLAEMVPVINLELSKIDTWLQSYRLALNVTKTSFMIFSNKNKALTNPIVIRIEFWNR